MTVVPTPHVIQPYRPADLFTSFWRAAHWTWERRLLAKQRGFPFSEETITETILLDLAAEHPLEILVQPLNKIREGKIGADWEWCFYNKGSNRFLRTLVQAKRLDDTETEYTHLDHKYRGTKALQMNRLLRNARKRGIPALYVFYNHLSDLRGRKLSGGGGRGGGGGGRAPRAGRAPPPPPAGRAPPPPGGPGPRPAAPRRPAPPGGGGGGGGGGPAPRAYRTPLAYANAAALAGAVL